ncbi:MAG: DUF2461 domain-containing protein [Clostridiales bacterium]|jgi:uncharacterized protein (TIGR02453 family)|nr:DUF2461 domain-containing protein [Clostridiales bacterium]
MANFEGFSTATIDFMWNLRLNNNKAWFEEHKPEFIEVFQTPMKALGREVFEHINTNFGGRGFIHKVSRIYKDARRVKGGEPYRCNLWFSIERPVPNGMEWTSTPVFWFELTPENWTYGLGYYSARAETMAKLRARIDKNPKAFEKFVALLEKQNEFALEGAEYVRKKEAPTKKVEAWYNKKSFSLIHEQQHGAELFTSDLVGRIVSGYTFLMPFYDYFITLDSDPGPVKTN